MRDQQHSGLPIARKSQIGVGCVPVEPNAQPENTLCLVQLIFDIDLHILAAIPQAGDVPPPWLNTRRKKR